MSCSATLLLAVAAFGMTLPAGASAQERIQLTPAQREKALSFIQSHETYKKTETTRRVLCELQSRVELGQRRPALKEDVGAILGLVEDPVAAPALEPGLAP